MSSIIKKPGEIWWAYHPWLSHVEFQNGDSSRPTTRSIFSGIPKYVRMPCKPHPALILAPGDEIGRGYLVCYLSSHTRINEEIPRKELKNVSLGNGKPSYIFCMAPCYCDDHFLMRRITVATSGMIELAKGFMKRACKLMENQPWVEFGIDSIENDWDTTKVEEFRSCVRNLIDAIRQSELALEHQSSSTSKSKPQNDPELVLSAALPTDVDCLSNNPL